MTERVDRAGLKVARELADFVEAEALARDAGWRRADFWAGFGALVAEYGPRNRALLARRDELQAQIDAWHIAPRGRAA